MVENVRPTRMELLNTKQRYKLAEKGHKILKQKRDALVMEFFTIIKKAADLRGRLDAKVLAAYKAMVIARAFHGDSYMEAQAIAAHAAPGVNIKTKNIMGIKIPAISIDEFQKHQLDNAYGTSAKFDEAVTLFRECLELSVQLAETETAIKRLLMEIEKTNRRVNALEYNVQPRLKRTIKGIAEHLNRLESEQFFALKVTKRRLTKAAQAKEEADRAKKNAS